MNKPRLRYSKNGWYKYGGSMLLGAIDVRTGAWVPDPRYPTAKKAEFWTGPFRTACEAFAVKGLAE